MYNQDFQDFLEDVRLHNLIHVISMSSNHSEHNHYRQSPKLRNWGSIEEPESIPEIYPTQGETNNIPEEAPQKPEIIVPDQRQEIQEVEQFSCSCSKSRCLQMYCSCFHNGRVCGKSCKCQDCENAEDHLIEREKAVNHAKKNAHRSKKVPEKIFETTEIWGCNCSKTRCVKNYCECFIRGKKCSLECNCQHCDNRKDEDLINEIKMQNQRQNQLKKRIRKTIQLLQ